MMFKKAVPMLIIYSSIVSMFPPQYRLALYVMTVFLAFFMEEEEN
jgi:hypothetical protein